MACQRWSSRPDQSAAPGVMKGALIRHCVTCALCEAKMQRMAIYHLSAKPISRATGRSATGAAAYRAGETITDERTGLVFDYSKKRGIDHSEIMAQPMRPSGHTTGPSSGMPLSIPRSAKIRRWPARWRWHYRPS